MYNTQMEKFSLKDQLFNLEKVEKISHEIYTVFPAFQEDVFTQEVVGAFAQLELKERITHICNTLHRYLPSQYDEAIDILLLALPPELDSSKEDDDFGDFIYAPYGEFVQRYGCNEKNLSLSLRALREVTKRFSVEYAIRDFINTYPDETLAMLALCAKSDNYHERRLASEGLRPKLPWAKKLTLDYHVPFVLLNQLFSDRTRYVTRSVANHLNDVSKIDAPYVIETLKHWQQSKKQNAKEMAFISKHALRTLVKVGDKDALALLGFKKNVAVELKTFSLAVQSLCVGETLMFDVHLYAKEDADVLLDYIIHFRTKQGKFSSKVHKFKQLTLEKGESIILRKKHLFKANMSTRTLYEGEHRIGLQLNGKIIATQHFMLMK